MLYRLEKLLDMSISASDGMLGKVEGIYFDDCRWAVRYLVVKTSDGLPPRHVLVSPIAIRSINWIHGHAQLRPTLKQLTSSPEIDVDSPVSRQQELEVLDHYGYPDYWTKTSLWGETSFPEMRTRSDMPDLVVHPDQRPMDHHLRSLKEVKNCSLQATDAVIGSLESFLMDHRRWALRYVIVDTCEWCIGKHAVIPPQWITATDWQNHVIYVDCSRGKVRQAPEFDFASEPSRGYETALFAHYDRPVYWH